MPQPQIMTHVLANGLTLAAEMRPDVRAAAFHLLIPAGAVTDPEGQDGLSKVLTDMCYRGTTDLDSRSLSDRLDGLGIQRSDGVGSEAASFGGALLADNLSDALQLHADVVRRPSLPDDELPAVVALALQELLALDDQPAQKMFERLRSAYFTNEHGRSPLGTKEALLALTISDLQAAHPKRLLPNGAILSVAGRLDWGQLKDEVECHFGDWQGSAPQVPPPAYRHTAHYEHVEQDTAQEHIGVAYASVPPDHHDRYAARIAVAVLSGGMGARLFTEVREKRGLVYSVSAAASAVRHHGYVLAYAGTTPERSQETLDVLLHELRRLREGVTDDEVKRARTGLLSSLVMQGESTAARAGAIASDLLHLGRIRSLDEIRQGIEGISPRTIVEHLERRPAKDFTVVTLGPRKLTPDADVTPANAGPNSP